MAGTDRTPIIVAVIGLVGVVSTALFANWDKIVPRPAPASLSAPPSSTTTATQIVASQPAHIPTGNVAALAAAQGRALDGETDALNGVADQIDAASVVKVAGTWRDSDGYWYNFIQEGRAYTFRQFKDGAEVGSGHGILKGRDFAHDFTAKGVGPGHCTGQIAPDGVAASGQCRGASGPPWSFSIQR